MTSRIDQILAAQRALVDPAAAAPAQATSVAPTPSAAAAPGAATPFAGVLAGAMQPAAAPDTTGAGKVQAMTQMADSLIGKPYVMGGGHGGWAPSAGYDCSGFVSAVLHAGGYLSQPCDTTSLPSQPDMQSGPGQAVTVYDRALPGGSGHVIIQINGQFYESGGSHGAWGGGGGVAKIARPSDAYLATFPTVLHPAGL